MCPVGIGANSRFDLLEVHIISCDKDPIIQSHSHRRAIEKPLDNIGDAGKIASPIIP